MTDGNWNREADGEIHLPIALKYRTAQAGSKEMILVGVTLAAPPEGLKGQPEDVQFAMYPDGARKFAEGLLRAVDKLEARNQTNA